MNKRLLFLENLVKSGSADSFSRYALALEYRREQRAEDAIGVFEELRQLDPAYVPQYLMAGQILLSLGRTAEAKKVFEEGIERAQTARDSHAESELRSALTDLED